MLFLVVLVIALGWAGWIWAWGRDRYTASGGLGLPPSPFAVAPASRLSSPRDSAGARMRRRQVLGSAGVGLLLAFLIARAWSPMWVPTIGIAAFLGWYGLAVYRIETGNTGPAVKTIQQRFGPVIDDQAPPVETDRFASVRRPH